MLTVTPRSVIVACALLTAVMAAVISKPRSLRSWSLRMRIVLAPRWVVQSFSTALQALADADGVKVEGLISAFTSAAVFSVNGRPVDASTVAGTPGLAAGVRVEVQGSLRAGILRASTIRILSDQDLNDRGFEVTAAITAVSAAQATITLRGVTVSTARSDLNYQSGTAADLVVGRTVEVRGALSADRRVLEATRIRFR